MEMIDVDDMEKTDEIAADDAVDDLQEGHWSRQIVTSWSAASKIGKIVKTFMTWKLHPIG